MDKRPAAPRPHKQTRQRRGAEQEPRLPHEHDESPDSQSSTDPMVRKAAEDVAAGREDTSKSNEMDRVYQRQKRPG
jgi:hypothetical protein